MSGPSPSDSSVDSPPLRALGLSLIALALSAIPAAALAAGEEEKDESPFYAAYRIWAEGAGGVDLTPEAVTNERRPGLLHQRLRLHYNQSFGDFRGVAGADLLTGTLVGTAPDLSPTEAASGTRVAGGVVDRPENIFAPRQAYIEWQSDRSGRVKLGLQTSHWGLGISANDGVAEEDRLFNHRYGGDRVFRASYTAAPFAAIAYGAFAQNFHVGLGADFVFRDDEAALSRGDRAGRGLLALLYKGDQFELGHYMTYRGQRDANGDRLTSFQLDYFGNVAWVADSGWDFRIGAESVVELGATDRIVAEGSEAASIRGFGTAAEFEAGHIPSEFRFRLLGGYASGDSDRQDDTLRGFQFDPNYQVGLVLFDHYLPQVTAQGYRGAVDPARGAHSPEGAAEFVNDGGVHNAVYLNPMVLFGQREGLLTGLGVLWARAVEPVADPAATFANGGTPTGPAGATPATRNLGWEADVATRYRHQLDVGLTLEVKAEYGLLFPGDAFASDQGTPAPPNSLFRGSLAAIW